MLKQIKQITGLLFLVSSSSLTGQITFSEIVEAVNNHDSNYFTKDHLISIGFFPGKIDKYYESWGYDLESGKASAWLHISRTETNAIGKIQLISWGHEIHSELIKEIVKNCKYRRVRRHYEGTYYMVYQYKDILEINIWEGEKDGIEYYIIDIYFTENMQQQ